MTPNLPTDDPNVTINLEQRLYVIKHPAGGYSCLGFAVALERARKYAEWAEVPGPDPARAGTAAGWADYQRCLSAAYAQHAATGEKCPAELEPRLIGLEGRRIEIEPGLRGPGTKDRFWLSRSGGWSPCHIAVARRNCHGGPAVYLPDGAVVRVIGTERIR